MLPTLGCDAVSYFADATVPVALCGTVSGQLGFIQEDKHPLGIVRLLWVLYWGHVHSMDS
jgi:hypothetical protein